MAEHVGYVGRTLENYRYEGDPDEVVLRISKEAASDILCAIHVLANTPHYPTKPDAIEAVATALEALGITGY